MANENIRIDCAHQKLVNTEQLKENPDNPNFHSPEQTTRLAKLIAAHGWRHPIIVSKRSKFIVSGHGRLAAARQLGMKLVPVDYQDYESDEEEYAVLVSDNEISHWAYLDLARVNLKLPELGPDFDLDLLGIKDFGLDPPGITKGETPSSDHSADEGKEGIEVIRLYYEPEDYADLNERAQDLMDKLGLNDMSSLFKHLVIEKHLGSEHNEIADA